MGNNGKKLWFHSTGVKIALIAIIAFAAGFLIKSHLQPSEADAEHKHPGEDAVAQEQTLWTCPMHPNIRVPEPGKW
ncbi:MAG: heavy metal-binding domain-containing protein [Planctomycetota bacterium]|jgi:Cu(I)/Ag(I) efflux system membrane fusion protein